MSDTIIAPTAVAAKGLMAHVVRVEANFLRLPLFALDTRQLRKVHGIQCEGSFRRGQVEIPFRYVVTRNVATLYPGPLARSAHFALLSLATDRGLPVANPIPFTWRELCSRMGIQPSGRTVQQLRAALTAIKGLMIESHHAIYAKGADQTLTPSEEYGQVLGIYDELEFHGAMRADGSVADVNAVWFSRWYRDNLNALYSGPLDHALWTSLDGRSPITSRLYEFLSYKFSCGRDLLRFNYATLVKFVPVRGERYASRQKQQLGPAFDLLISAGLLSRVDWVESKGGESQLLLHRGPLLGLNPSSPADAYDVGEEDFRITPIRGTSAPESELVRAFHSHRGHADYQPTRAELALAKELLKLHGVDFATTYLPRVVKKLEHGWKDAKSFVAIARYLPDVLRDVEREQASKRRAADEARRERVAREEAIRRSQDRAVLETLWHSLPAERQHAIRQRVLASQPSSIAKFPNLVTRFCLDELARAEGLVGLAERH